MIARRLISAAAALALSVGLASALAAPAAHAAPEGPSSPLKVEFFHGDGRAGSEYGGLLVLSCFADNAQTIPVDCDSDTSDGFDPDLSVHSSTITSGKLTVQYGLPSTLGEYELTLSSDLEGAEDLTLTGTTYSDDVDGGISRSTEAQPPWA